MQDVPTQKRKTRAKARSPRRGHLIVFAGPSAARTTKIAAATAAALKRAGLLHRAVGASQDAPGSLSRHLADLRADPHAFGVSALPAVAAQALRVAARIDVMERLVLPALAAGEHVIVDDGSWQTSADVFPNCSEGVGDALIEVERRLWRDQSIILLIVEGQSAADTPANETYWHCVLGQMTAPVRTNDMGTVIVCLGKNLRTGRATDMVLRTLAMHKVIKGSKLQLQTEKSASTSRQLSIPFASEVAAQYQAQAASPAVFSRLSGARPSVVFDTYWRFAAERQNVFFRRLEGQGLPWTSDAILTAHKFTNAYRASDRVSQFLIKHVIYRRDLPQSVNEVCFRILLFKLFNKIETWHLLEDELGAVVHEDYTYKRYDQILSRALRAGRRIYSAAYIMPPGNRAFGHKAKHQNHLRLLELMMRNQVPAKLALMRRMQEAFELLRSFPTIGNFLAYQLVTDINYSAVTDFSETEFVMPGPGALDGIRKCFSSLGDLSEPDIIRLMADRQGEEFARLGLDFRSLFGRSLQLIDCQNLFCEVDKYARVAHPEIVGITGRSRIKQKFAPIFEPIDFWYPPKWGLNEAVEKFGGGQARNSACEVIRRRA